MRVNTVLHSVDIEEVHELIDSTSANYKLLDIRTTEAYDREHIPNSMHLPYRMIDSLNTMGWDKNTIYIVHSNNSEDPGIHHALEALETLGYSSIIFESGLQAWKSFGLQTVQSEVSKFCCGRGCGCSTN